MNSVLTGLSFNIGKGVLDLGITLRHTKQELICIRQDRANLNTLQMIREVGLEAV